MSTQAHAPSPARATLELLASMRFAVSLLTVVAIASTLGTVLKQGEPYANYLNQFGPFWFPAFQSLGLYSVYSAWWFLVILAFLVVSTSLCLWRNTPRMLREVGRFQLGLRERAFDNFHYRAEFSGVSPLARSVEQATAYLRQRGFDVRSTAAGDGTLIAAQAGMFRRFGYVLAHSAIVLICIGGLADSEALLKLQLALGAKVPVRGDVRLADVPTASRLGTGNLSFRGNTLVPEGKSSDVTVLNVGDGMLVQDLPFSISLQKFHIEHYSTGQPKLFASDVIVTDKDTGNSFKARIEVNKPLIHKGIAVYQASFDDGGTLIKIAPRSLLAPAAAPARVIEGRIGEVLSLELGGAPYQFEFSAFRPFNIENIGASDAEAAASSVGAGVGSLMSRMRSGLDAASRLQSKRELRNVGPSYQYKLRDTAGQAREYHNYMLPILVDGRWFLMTGMREAPGDAFRYLRLPLDDGASLDEFARLRDAVFNKSSYPEVGRRFAMTAAKADALSETMRTRLQETAERVLETFSQRGFQSVADFLEKAVPDDEREKAAEIYVRVLQGAAWEAWMLARERAGLKRMEADPAQARFVQDSLNSMSDAFFYGVPIYMQMSGFDEIKASVFQLTRSPGKPIVYLGCALLVLGIFAMFYLRERRLWLLVKPGGQSRMAYAPTRRTLDEDQAFTDHRDALMRILS
jgi:cytochrome c biogenesis protein